MNSAYPEQKSQLDVLARDLIVRYCRHRHTFPEKSIEFLLKILPVDIKTSSVAIEIVIDSLVHSSFPSHFLQGKKPIESFSDLSLAAVETLSDHNNHPRTTIELATAYWALGHSARLSFRQIKNWEGDTSNIKSIRMAEAAWEAIKRGRIVADRRFSDNEFVVYQLPPGVYKLLSIGLDIYNTNYGQLSPADGVSAAKENIGVENYLVF